MRLASAFFAVALALALATTAAAQDARLKDFWAACRNGDNAKVKEFLDAGLSPDSRFDAGMTPLLAAVSRRQLDTVKLLIERGADPSLRDDSYRLTPLGLAALFGVSDVAVYLLPHNKNNEDMDVVLVAGVNDRVPALVEAALKAHPSPLLLTRALHLATTHREPNPEIIAALQKAGAQPKPSLSEEQLQRFVGTYRDATKLDLEIVLRDGKLIGTGGAGFEEFFEQEMIPLAPDTLLLSSDPNFTFHFAGKDARFSAVKIMIPGTSYDLQRIGGKP